MNKIDAVFLFLLTLFITSAFGQSNYQDTFLENTPDSIRFRTYLDSMRGSLSHNHTVFERNINRCSELYSKNIKLPLKDKFEFALQSMYHNVYDKDLVTAYKIANDFQHLVNEQSIPSNARNAFIYMQGYISMELGEAKTAQKIFYSQIEKGERLKDTMSIIQSLYSLGQLFKKERDYKSSEEYLLRCLNLNESFPSTAMLGSVKVLLELITLRTIQKKYALAEQNLDTAFVKMEIHKMLDDKVHYYLLKSELELEQNQFSKAENNYLTANDLARELKNKHLIAQCEGHYLDLLKAKGDHTKLLKLVEGKIAKNPASNFLGALKWYKHAHQSANQIGAFEKAYQYSLQEKIIEDSIVVKNKIQQTALLKVKFESDQKEKANQILTAQIAQEQSQNQLLYALIALFLITSLGLLGAFFQKRKYNRRLRKEVKKRTKELERTNQELDQFNRILSHDLKEPLRSIVGFSTLAQRKIETGSNPIEYLDLIVESGKQLHQLIEDVSTFQSIGDDFQKQITTVNTKNVILSITDQLSVLIAQKNARIKFHNLPIINAHDLFISIVFKNLIINGLFYNKKTSPIVDVSYFSKNQFHHFQFKDNGMGIPPQFQERIFKMFKRLDDRRTNKGSGLGLSISKKILTKINGDIKIIKSIEGEGSIFEVSFPILDEDKHSNHQLKMATAEH